MVDDELMTKMFQGTSISFQDLLFSIPGNLTRGLNDQAPNFNGQDKYPTIYAETVYCYFATATLFSLETSLTSSPRPPSLLALWSLFLKWQLNCHHNKGTHTGTCKHF